MTMSDDELLIKMNKMMRDTIAEVLEDVVYPRLVDMETSLTNKITDVKKEIKESESRLTTRIDNIAKIVTETKTDHEIRIVRLEENTGIYAN